MAVTTVLKDDFRNARRSLVVLGVIGTFAALVGILFVSEMNVYDDAYRALFDASALVGFLLPVIIAPLTYLAIAGDRADGAIKYALGLPNTRGEYFIAKYLSRAAAAVAAVLVATLLGFAIAALTFTNGADPVRFATFAAVSAVYALSTVGAFIGLSAMTASRSRAMFAVIGAYFVLGPFWGGFIPVLRLETLIDFGASLVNVTVSTATRETIVAIAPPNAYLSATEPVYAGVTGEYEALNAVFSGDDSLGDELWFNLATLAVWGVVVPVLGYLQFSRSELG